MSRTWSIVLSILAVFLFLLASVGFWMRTSVLDEDSFVEISTETFAAEKVRLAIAEGIVDRALENNPVILNFVRGPASEIIAGILGATIVERVFERLARLFYEVAVYNNGQEVSINIEPIKEFVSQIVNILAPEGSAAVQVEQLPDQIVILNEGELPAIQDYIIGVEWFTLIVGLIAIGLLVLVLWRGWSTSERNSYLKWIGGSLAIGAFILVLLTWTVGSTAVLTVDEQTGRTIVSETYDNLVQQLRVQSFGLFVIGIGIWLIGWWQLRETRQEEEVVVTEEPAPGDDLPEAEAPATT